MKHNYDDETLMEKGEVDSASTDRAQVVGVGGAIDSFKGWLPLAGLLMVHLLLGLLVDRLKSGKPLAIEEILAR